MYVIDIFDQMASEYKSSSTFLLTITSNVNKHNKVLRKYHRRELPRRRVIHISEHGEECFKAPLTGDDPEELA